MDGYKKFKTVSLSIMLLMGCMNIHAAADDRKEQAIPVDPVTAAINDIYRRVCCVAGAAVAGYVIAKLMKQVGLVTKDETITKIAATAGAGTIGALAATDAAQLSELIRAAYMMMLHKAIGVSTKE